MPGAKSDDSVPDLSTIGWITSRTWPSTSASLVISADVFAPLTLFSTTP